MTSSNVVGLRLRAGAERGDHADVRARADDLGVGAHGGVDRVDAAVDQRVGAGAGGVGDLDGLEVGRRRGGGAGRLGHREVVGVVGAGARGAEEEREAVLEVVGRDEDVGDRVLEAGVAEIGGERGVERGVVVALVDQAAGGGDLLAQRAVEDLRPLGAVELGQRRRRSAAACRRAPGRVRPQARMPPVEVPAIRSNSSAVGRPVRRSISASTRAGIRPRMPPPSIERTFTAGKTRDSRAPRPRPQLRDAGAQLAVGPVDQQHQHRGVDGQVAEQLVDAEEPQRRVERDAGDHHHGLGQRAGDQQQAEQHLDRARHADELQVAPAQPELRARH